MIIKVTGIEQRLVPAIRVKRKNKTSLQRDELRKSLTEVVLA